MPRDKNQAARLARLAKFLSKYAANGKYRLQAPAVMLADLRLLCDANEWDFYSIEKDSYPIYLERKPRSRDR